MFCSKCGNELQEGQVFCPKCGTSVKVFSEVHKSESKVSPLADESLAKSQKVNPFGDEFYEPRKKRGNGNMAWIILIIAIIIACIIGINDKSAGSSQTSSASPEQRCKDAQGRPKDTACRIALRSKGFNVDKYVNWGGADNGKNAAICTATDAAGTLYAFEVVFDEKCNAISVKIADF
ncbi:zinc-ribbon domain-containing protein [Fibrobacter sp. UWOV1]|uniref:zinc ribbon domain-containing protein n=1 Tax=Fibrobacter sp. UWOV1 TaxID=1896215 RepID=UPI000918D99E|nr:zinc ribbon domain-containing protein [Fibrobacter sp. UWOV1]SHL62673.1 zinc-ribbon domain-containing protein [Fibrobacter sp. UWOV1]